MTDYNEEQPITWNSEWISDNRRELIEEFIGMHSDEFGKYCREKAQEARESESKYEQRIP